MPYPRTIRARRVVSDHALVRHLERALGVDVDALRRDVLDIVEPGIERGASAVRKDGRAYLLTSGVCVTVYPKGTWIEHAAVRRGPRPPRDRDLA